MSQKNIVQKISNCFNILIGHHMKHLKKLKMTLLDVTDLDKTWTENSTWQSKIFEPSAKVRAPLVWNLWKNKN